jgi:uncharacterized iron-regulated membrane protein
LALGRPPRRGALRTTSPWLAVPVIAAALVVGWFVPLVGLSLLAFLAIDLVVGLVARKRVKA